MNIDYHRPALYPKQSKAIFHEKRYGLTEATTKSGKTFGALAWLIEQQILGSPGQNFWWVAPVYPQADIAYRRLKQTLPRDLYDFHDSKLRVTCNVNQTAIWCKSGEKSDNLYGDDVYAAVMDEASRMREESWFALRSTLTYTKGRVRLIGNVKGRANFFYKLCRRAEAGDPEMEYHKITCWDAVEAGILSKEEIDDAKRTLPENVFRELYLAEPSDDGGNPFGISAIEACIAPLSKEPVACYGIDLAKSHDYTTIIGLDAKGNTVHFDRFQKPWQDTIRYIRELVGYVRALVDSTGVGDPVLEALQSEGRVNYEGYKFTAPSKQMLMEGLAVAIQSKKITYPAGHIPNELMSFEYAYSRTGIRYSAPEGLFDDCVCALALAVQHMRGATIGDNILEYYKSLNLRH